MQLIRTKFRDTKSFSEAYQDSPASGSLFCPTTKPLRKNQQVLVEVHFPGLPNKMLLTGRVLSWRSALPRLRVRAGAMVAFGENEAEKIAFILAIAAGEKTGATKRKYARLPLELQVKWRLAESVEGHDGHLRDISVGGAQLVTDQEIAPGVEIVLELVAPGGAQPISIAGRVSNVKPDAYGVSFLYRQGGGSRRLKEVVRRLVDSRVGSSG